MGRTSKPHTRNQNFCRPGHPSTYSLLRMQGTRSWVPMLPSMGNCCGSVNTRTCPATSGPSRLLTISAHRNHTKQQQHQKYWPQIGAAQAPTSTMHPAHRLYATQHTGYTPHKARKIYCSKPPFIDLLTPPLVPTRQCKNTRTESPRKATPALSPLWMHMRTGSIDTLHA